jgi:citrate synthase
MAPPPDESSSPAVIRPARATARSEPPWRTAVTHVEPNRILVRGYAVDEMMGRLTFAEAVYLLLVGELPSPAIGRLMEALLVSSIDHGTTPPSTLAARNVATTGAPLRASVAAGILAFGEYHGGDVETCLRFLEAGVAMVHRGVSYESAAARLLGGAREQDEPVPGFGHRIHTHDPRAARLFQMALELELDGDHMQMMRAVERVLNAHCQAGDPRTPINVDGAIAAVCGDIGLSPAVGNALFIISRVPGLIAQAQEEREREHRMRQIDSTRAIYDGPRERRLPDKRHVGG